MPDRAPATDEIIAAKLFALGEQLRAQRKRIGVSATTVAEAAGMSRVTLHRIMLDPPGNEDLVYGVATLTPLDAAASKLLANSDRCRGDAVLCRDLIDLAMMAPTKALLRQAIVKAQGAYGASIEADLRQARFRTCANARTAWTIARRRCA